MYMCYYVQILEIVYAYYWRANEASETLVGLSNENRRYNMFMSNLTFVAQAKNYVK